MDISMILIQFVYGGCSGNYTEIGTVNVCIAMDVIGWSRHEIIHGNSTGSTIYH